MLVFCCHLAAKTGANDHRWKVKQGSAADRGSEGTSAGTIPALVELAVCLFTSGFQSQPSATKKQTGINSSSSNPFTCSTALRRGLAGLGQSVDPSYCLVNNHLNTLLYCSKLRYRLPILLHREFKLLFRLI